MEGSEYKGRVGFTVVGYGMASFVWDMVRYMVVVGYLGSAIEFVIVRLGLLQIPAFLFAMLLKKKGLRKPGLKLKEKSQKMANELVGTL